MEEKGEWGKVEVSIKQAVGLVSNGNFNRKCSS